MPFSKKEKQQAVLLIDLYKSAVDFSLVYTKNTECDFINSTDTLDYLRIEEPKRELREESLRNALQDASKKLNRKLKKLGIDDFVIFVLPHGDLSKMQNDELYVKLPEKTNINEDSIADIVEKHHLNESSFKNLLENKENEKMFFKSRKVISRISPNLYRTKSWRRSDISELSFLVTQTLVQEDLYKILQEELQALYPEKKLIFMNPNALLVISLENKRREMGLAANFNILDLGAEFMSFFQIYDGHAISSHLLPKGVNHLIRKIDSFEESFELSESALRAYLSGNCKGENCKKIKSLLEEFEKELKEEISKMKLNPFLKSDIIIMSNPDLNKNIVIWLSNVFAKLLGEHLQLDLDFEKNSRNIMRQYFCSNKLINDKKDRIIIFE